MAAPTFPPQAPPRPVDDAEPVPRAARPPATPPLSRVPTRLRPAVRTLAAPIVQDALLAAVLTAVGIIGVFAHLEVDIPEGGGVSSLHRLDPLGVALILLQTVPLIWRRVAPLAVLCVTATALILFFALGYFLSFAAFGFLVALYTVAAHGRRRTSAIAAIACGFVLLVIMLFAREPWEPDAVIGDTLVVAGAWFLGDAARARRGEMVQLEDRASRLERGRERWVRDAVASERRVIARELHDVVAHNVSVIVAQAGAAQRIFPIAPEDSLASLGAIEQTGREALVEMRRLTGFLRTEREDADDRAPQPGLADLEALLDQVREAGLPVSLRVDGEAGPLPPGLDLSAFRIIQEALTNVLKHAGPATADVSLHYDGPTLEIRVVDDGIGARPSTFDGVRSGFGHLGMRERVALFDGSLRVGPRAGGGYEVLARLAMAADDIPVPEV